MARIPLVRPADASEDVKAEYAKIVREHGVVTNMKATLLHSLPALHAVLEWYTLADRVKPFLGERLSILFCDAISRENACELCATFMRRAIIQRGEDPAHLELSEREQAVVDFGRQLAADPNRVSDALYARLAAHFTPAEIVELTVFGALMIVNNVFNSALRVDVDESLGAWRIQPETAFA
jgi:alkylhydroperoxidase family enzyme